MNIRIKMIRINLKKKKLITTGLAANAATYIKYNFCPGEYIQEQVNQTLSQKLFPIFKCQVSYVAKNLSSDG